MPESDPELTAMLSWAAESVGLHWRPPPSPERSRLDDWFLGRRPLTSSCLQFHSKATNLGPARSEPGPSQAPVQDVNAESHLPMHPPLRLVCSDRPEGRVLSCLDPPSKQTVSPLCIEERALQYKVLPFGLSLSPCVFTKVVEAAFVPLREKGICVLN